MIFLPSFELYELLKSFKFFVASSILGNTQHPTRMCRQTLLELSDTPCMSYRSIAHSASSYRTWVQSTEVVNLREFAGRRFFRGFLGTFSSCMFNIKWRRRLVFVPHWGIEHNFHVTHKITKLNDKLRLNYELSV